MGTARPRPDTPTATSTRISPHPARRAGPVHAGGRNGTPVTGLGPESRLP